MAHRDIFGRPATARRLLVCTGPCCNPDGSAEVRLEELRQTIVKEGYEEALVGRASCVRRACLGKCSGDPLAFVDPDETWYYAFSSGDLLKILQEHVLHGAPIAELICADED
ncbi:MAG: (2Fe-2S) ferredoxin domain-containing protein [Methylovirgula sp.]